MAVFCEQLHEMKFRWRKWRVMDENEACGIGDAFVEEEWGERDAMLGQRLTMVQRW